MRLWLTELIGCEHGSRLGEEFSALNRFVPHLCAKIRELFQHVCGERRIARDHKNRNMLLRLARSNAIEQTEAIDERHSQVHDHRVWTALIELAERLLRVLSDEDTIAADAKHSCERLGDGFVVLDDKDGRVLRRDGHAATGEVA